MIGDVGLQIHWALYGYESREGHTKVAQAFYKCSECYDVEVSFKVSFKDEILKELSPKAYYCATL